MPSGNNITAQRVSLIDPSNNTISTEWYNFLLTLFNLSGRGVSVVATLDFPNTLAGTSSDLTVTVPDVKPGDEVTVTAPNACVLADCCYTGWVSGPNAVKVRLNNYSAAPKDPPSGDFRVTTRRY